MSLGTHIYLSVKDSSEGAVSSLNANKLWLVTLLLGSGCGFSHDPMFKASAWLPVTDSVCIDINAHQSSLQTSQKKSLQCHSLIFFFMRKYCPGVIKSQLLKHSHLSATIVYKLAVSSCFRQN